MNPERQKRTRFLPGGFALLVKVFWLAGCAWLSFGPLVAHAAAQEAQKQLAVLKLEFENFPDDERQAAELAFYEQLLSEPRVTVLSEAQVHDSLDAGNLDNDNDYLRAGRTLAVDFVLVGKLARIGAFVDVTLLLYDVSNGTQVRIPGGTTNLVEKGIPDMVAQVFDKLGLAPLAVSPPDSLSSAEEQRSNKRNIIVFGGGVLIGGTVAAMILLGGSDRQALPRPPVIE